MGGEHEGTVEYLFFFFQAEDGIRDSSVTGVQTCALPISPAASSARARAQRRPASGNEGSGRQVRRGRTDPALRAPERRGHEEGREAPREIGRASCRERV